MAWSAEDRENLEEAAPDMGAPLQGGSVRISSAFQEAQSGYATEYPVPEKRFVAVLEAWRLQLGIERMLLVAHSLGGLIAFCYAEGHPGAIAEGTVT